MAIFKCIFDEIDRSDSLTHYGVKGMKWGVRKDDGLTSAGGGGGIQNDKLSEEDKEKIYDDFKKGKISADEAMQLNLKDLEARYKNGEIETSQYVNDKLNLAQTYGSHGLSKSKRTIEGDVERFFGLYKNNNQSQQPTNTEIVQNTREEQHKKNR